jgi:Zn-dependent protease with chaperone function
MQQNSLRKDFLKALLFAALSLFVVPLSTFLFTEYAQAERDGAYTAELISSAEAAHVTDAQLQEERDFLAAHPPSSACDDPDESMARYRSIVCDRYSELWQYHLADKVARACLIGGAGVLLAIFGIGALAFFNRRAQYLSLVTGWNLLRLTSALQVVTQGALVVWLSFWLTAFFTERYFVKLIVIAAIVAGAAVLHAIAGILKRPPAAAPLPGRFIDEAGAPKLWAHLRRCADHLGTAPPEHLVAGIDANFFVTESPLTVGERTSTGRSLYVSLPLLRVLDRAEADAVLLHELAHFRGGDTASSARLGPKLVEFDHYCTLMLHGGATVVVFHVMYLYRLMFELALRRDSREREFLADRVASKVISARAIVQALIKVAAYSNYRSEVERQLFEQDSRHDGTIGIAGRVAAGLAPYAGSTHFVDSMKTANVPHPFDSHPPLAERMRNVGHEIAEPDFAAIVASVPAEGWIADIAVAEAVESELWSEYERQFADAHEQSLAYRYLPATEEERAIVLRHFPDLSIALGEDERFAIQYAGVQLPGSDELVSWDDVDDFQYENGIGADVLSVKFTRRSGREPKLRKVKLRGISGRRQEFQQSLGVYWHRHRVMRQSIPL